MLQNCTITALATAPADPERSLRPDAVARDVGWQSCAADPSGASVGREQRKNQHFIRDVSGSKPIMELEGKV